MKDWSAAEIQDTLESTTRKWWFFLAFLLLQLLPPCASKGYGLFEWPTVNMHIVTHALKLRCAALYPVFKVIPILLVASVLLFRNRVVKLFNVYTGVSYVLFAFLNSISITEEYGLGICTANLVMFLFIAALWFWEVVVGKNDFTARKEPVWKYWVVPVALVAFWQPVDSATLMPDFNPLYFLTSGAGLAFCLMTPVYLALLTILSPASEPGTAKSYEPCRGDHRIGEYGAAHSHPRVLVGRRAAYPLADHIGVWSDTFIQGRMNCPPHS